MSARTLSLLTLLVSLAALAGPHVAGASEPEMTQAPTIVLQGSTLVGSNGGWQSNSGSPTKYVFRFTRNGTTVKGPTSMPKTTQGDASLPAGTYPDDPNAYVYDLQAADSGQQMCVEVWGGIRSTYVYSDGSVAYDAWEWGHVSVYGQEAKACLTAPGSAPTTPSSPTTPTAPPAPAVPKPQAPLPPAATAAPEITGVAMVEQPLTATLGTWSGSQPLTVGLEWLRCDPEGENCQGLGITANTYTVGSRRRRQDDPREDHGGEPRRRARGGLRCDPRGQRAHADRAEPEHRRREGDRATQACDRPGQGADPLHRPRDAGHAPGQGLPRLPRRRRTRHREHPARDCSRSGRPSSPPEQTGSSRSSSSAA